MAAPIPSGIYFNNSQVCFNPPFISLRYFLLGFYRTTMAVATVYNIKMNPEKAITSQAPQIQGVLEKAAFMCGVNPSYPYIKEFHLPYSPVYLKKIQVPIAGEMSIPCLQFPVSTLHFVSDPAIAKQVLNPHRMDPRGPFDGASMSYEEAFKLLQKVFPETQFTPDDFLLTCGVEFTQIAHKQILEAIKLKDARPIIDELGQQFIDKWIKQKDVEISSEVRLLASSLITQLVFRIKDPQICKQLSESVEFMNGYLVNKALHLVTKEDEGKFTNACLGFRNITEEILKLDLPIFQIKAGDQLTEQCEKNRRTELTLAQKKGICLFMYFAGQETTAFALTYASAKLALNQEKQRALSKEVKIQESHEIRKFIHESLLEVPPARGVSRKLKSDAYIVFDTNEGKAQKYMRAGEKLTPMMTEMAEPLKNNPEAKAGDALIFGFGKNHCIGQILAMEELERFLRIFLSNAIITTKETVFNFQPKTTHQALPFSVQVNSRN